MSSADFGEFKGTRRFAVQRRLGSGGFGDVFQVLDRERNSVVALKTLRRMDPDALYRFKKEFRTLADLVHPNLVALYELLAEGHEWFFTMELVKGPDFLQFVRERDWRPRPVSTRQGGESDETVSLAVSDIPVEPAPPRPAGALSRPPPQMEKLRAALVQLAEGLLAVHQAGKLHRDIKPSNVLVTPEGRVKILDFGLVAELDSGTRELTRQVVGTPAYMAPEQVAGRPPVPASDWYSVGVLLYEALTGRRPLEGNLVEVLARKRSLDPPPPSTVVPDVPDDLDSLCHDLLRPDPSARPSGEAVLARLTGSVSGLVLEGASLPAGAKTPLVGRQEHLAVLEQALREAGKKRAVIVHVHGRSGMGKTDLLRRFLDDAKEREPGAVILEGRCYQQESVPYKALDSLVDSLSQYLNTLAPAEADALMPDDAQVLGRLFPVLLQVRAVRNARRRVLEIADSRELRRRAFAAIRQLLLRLSRARLLVLVIDDLQWGDLDSAALLGEVLRPPDPPPVLLIVSYRSEEAGASPLLSPLSSREDLRNSSSGSARSVRILAVEELSHSDAKELARTILGSRPAASEAVAEFIARESGGNPLFIHELARSVLAGAEPAAESERPENGDRGAETTLDAVIGRRVARLPKDARALLEVVCVSGCPVERSVARRAAAIDMDEQSAVAILRAGRLIRAAGTGGQEEIETYHDRIRETVVAHLSPELLKGHHRSLATALLEFSSDVNPEAVAVHFQEAGDLEKTPRYAMEGAARASEALAFDRAARLYRLALELQPSDDLDTRALRLRLGDALSNAGRGAEAAQAYLEAARGAGPAEALELNRRAAEQFLRGGYVDEGLSVLRIVLDAVGMKLPRTPLTALLTLLLLRLRIRLRGLGFEERSESRIPAADLIRIDTCWAVASGLGFVDTVRGGVFQRRGLLLALEAGEPFRVARALAVEAAYSSISGGKSRPRTDALNQKAMEMAERLKHPRALGLATVTAGIAAFFEGRWSDCRNLLERAETLLKEQAAGVAFELDNVVYCTLFSLFQMGEVKELCDRVPRYLEDARERGDRYMTTNLRVRVSYLAHLAGDDAAGAREELARAMEEWSNPRGFQNQHWWNLLGQAQIDLYARRGEAAWELVMQSWPALTRSFALRIQLIAILAHALRGRAALAAAADGREVEPLIRIAEGDAGWIESERMPWAGPLASLLRAGIATFRGDAQEILGKLEEAEMGYEAADMRLLASVCRFRRGQLLGGQKGGALIVAGTTFIAGQGIRSHERMADMLAPGRWPG
jgi:serine/threonine protein kinase/tetratricopeptide (TPR) repeat protein